MKYTLDKIKAGDFFKFTIPNWVTGIDEEHWVMVGWNEKNKMYVGMEINKEIPPCSIDQNFINFLNKLEIHGGTNQSSDGGDSDTVDSET